MKTIARLAIAVAVSFAVVSCSSSSTPSAPSAPAAPVNTVPIASLKITGAPLVVGDTVQFSATAKMTDQSTQDVTTLAAWSSSNPALATVNALGQVTAIKEGGVSIHASYRGLTDSQYENVTPLLFFKAAGTVSEAPPVFAGVAGASIEVTAGTNRGTVIYTDGSGNFSFGPLKGDNYTFRIRRDGYLDATKTIALTRDQGNIDILLYPVPPAGATARCKDKSWSSSTDKASACSKNGGVAYWACPGPFC